MKDKYSESNEDQNLVMVKLLLSKVAEESCLWVSWIAATIKLTKLYVK